MPLDSLFWVKPGSLLQVADEFDVVGRDDDMCLEEGEIVLLLRVVNASRIEILVRGRWACCVNSDARRLYLVQEPDT